MAQQQKEYVIGVMKTPVGELDDAFTEIVNLAVEQVEQELRRGKVGVSVDLFQFVGPHLTATAGVFSPLDFLQVALVEKLERRANFLLVVTEVDLAAQLQSYAVALPSELINIGVISMRRLAPSFWGEVKTDHSMTARRLAAAMLHTLGHLLGLRHEADPANPMHDFDEVADLDRMGSFTPEQAQKLHRMLPVEARDLTWERGQWGRALQRIGANLPVIWRAVVRANPFDLAVRFTTMVTVALSLIIVLFFSAEIWDLAGAMTTGEVLLFSAVAVLAATAVVYRAFALRSVSVRGDRTAESVVVTQAATLLSLFLTILVLYAFFALLMFLAARLIFPDPLMASWATINPVDDMIDHIRLAIFLASMGVLAGSLGGAVQNREVIRHILFLDEET